MISKRLHESFICPHLWFNWLIASWRAGCWLVDEIITGTCGSSANYKYHIGTLCFETLHSLLEMNWSMSVAWKFCWTKKQIQSILTKSFPFRFVKSVLRCVKDNTSAPFCDGRRGKAYFKLGVGFVWDKMNLPLCRSSVAVRTGFMFQFSLTLILFTVRGSESSADLLGRGSEGNGFKAGGRWQKKHQT